MKTDIEPFAWATGIGLTFAAVAQVSGVPVLETAKNIISCLDGHGFHCR